MEAARTAPAGTRSDGTAERPARRRPESAAQRRPAPANAPVNAPSRGRSAQARGSRPVREETRLALREPTDVAIREETGRSGQGGAQGRKNAGKKGSMLGTVVSAVILVVSLAVFAFSAFQLYRIYSGYQKGEEEYDDLTTLAINQEEERFTVDFASLQEINPDVVGWIRFEDPSVINYPVVQGEDNDEYLEKTFKGYDNTVGTIFVNAHNHADFNDQNTIIYGHYMNNGSMFNQLEEYLDKEQWEHYPFFYIYTPDGAEIKYQIYAAGVVEDTSIGYTYEFADTAEFQNFLDETRASSAYDTGTEPGTDAQIVTLSTCTKDNNHDRMVIHAMKVSTDY